MGTAPWSPDGYVFTAPLQEETYAEVYEGPSPVSGSRGLCAQPDC